MVAEPPEVAKGIPREPAEGGGRRDPWAPPRADPRDLPEAPASPKAKVVLEPTSPITRAVSPIAEVAVAEFVAKQGDDSVLGGAF